MLIWNLLQISVFISVTIAVPLLGTILARLSEARARALTHRAQLQANSARLHARLQQRNRLKREIYDDFEERCPDDSGGDFDFDFRNAQHHHGHKHDHQTIIPSQFHGHAHQTIVPPPLPSQFHSNHHNFVHPPPVHHQTVIDQHQFANHLHGGGAINQAQEIQTIRENNEDVSGQVFDPFDQRQEILQFFKDYEEHQDDSQKFRSNEDVDLRCSSEELEFRSNDSNETVDNLQSLFVFRPEFYRDKRSLSRLITDPRAKLDIPKTMENLGTVTKHALEDEHTPMYHMRNLIGSSKDTLLSAMRIPPQQLIIPSQYRIVKHNDELNNNGENNAIDSQFDQTFQRVGKMMRDSIRSSQDTIAHFNDMAHDARNIVHTSRHALPKLIIPYAHTSALQQRARKPSAVLITPRIFDVAEQPLWATKKPRDFVQLGHIMDAIGLSRPDRNKIDYQKIEFKPKTSILQETNRNLPRLLQRFKDNNLDSVGETVDALKEAKISIGAKNLRDFLLKMRGELTNIVEEQPQKQHEKIKLKKHHKHNKIEDREIVKFVENLFNDIRILPKNETVGLSLTPELEHPFMGRISESNLKKFLESNNDPVKDEILQDFAHYLEDKEEISSKQRQQSSILGAINPLMFERMYNESLKLEHKATADQKEIFDKPVGTADPILKPFMGRLPEKKVQEFLNNFNEEQINEETED